MSPGAPSAARTVCYATRRTFPQVAQTAAHMLMYMMPAPMDAATKGMKVGTHAYDQPAWPLFAMGSSV